MEKVKVRVRYEKGDRVRFLSHLDVARVIQICVFRARWPVRMSQGFSPRPKLSFYAPLPVGTAGTGEYFDALLDGRPGLLQLAKSLSSALPAGFRLHQIDEVPEDAPSLEERIAYSEYDVDLLGVGQAEVALALDKLLREEHVTFSVDRPGESKVVDLRPFILDASIKWSEDKPFNRVVLSMSLAHQSGKTIRPQWVLHALSDMGLPIDPREAIIDRRKIVFEQER